MMEDIQDWTPWPEDVASQYRKKGYWQGQCLGEMLAERAGKTPQRMALMCGERHWTYAELLNDSYRCAHGLLDLGLQAGDRVLVQLPNVAEFFIMSFALFHLGAIPVFALPAHRQHELRHLLQISEAVAYVGTQTVSTGLDAGFDAVSMAQSLRADLPNLRHLIFVQGEGAGIVAFAQLLSSEHQPQLPMHQNDASALALLLLSGGSTGLPKLIPRTHDDYLYSVRESARICELDESTVYLSVLPVAHNFSLSSPGSFGVFYAGGCVVLSQTQQADQVFALIRQHRVNITAAVPPLAILWLEAAKKTTPQLDSLQVLQVGGAKFSAMHAQQVPQILGCRLQQVFGMAEGLVNYTRASDDEWLTAHTQGLAISLDDEIRVVDDEDQPVAEGEIGHLLTRGPYTIRGYYRSASHNRKAFTSDGFYRTGDRVRQLTSGHLMVEGRTKDQINRGGEKIAAQEIEELLLQYPEISDAALIALPDEFLGEKSCAVVVCNTAVKPMQLKQFLHQQGIAAYKIPDRVVLTESLPKTAVGKINKVRLQEMLNGFQGHFLASN